MLWTHAAGVGQNKTRLALAVTAVELARRSVFLLADHESSTRWITEQIGRPLGEQGEGTIFAICRDRPQLQDMLIRVRQNERPRPLVIFDWRQNQPRIFKEFAVEFETVVLVTYQRPLSGRVSQETARFSDIVTNVLRSENNNVTIQVLKHREGRNLVDFNVYLGPLKKALPPARTRWERLRERFKS